jgi:hypothetical protein
MRLTTPTTLLLNRVEATLEVMLVLYMSKHLHSKYQEHDSSAINITNKFMLREWLYRLLEPLAGHHQQESTNRSSSSVQNVVTCYHYVELSLLPSVRSHDSAQLQLLAIRCYLVDRATAASYSLVSLC